MVQAAGNAFCRRRRPITSVPPGQEHSARHRERLKRLGFRSDAELAEAIRSGALDDRLEQVAGELREMVADKLAVARPNHNRR